MKAVVCFLALSFFSLLAFFSAFCSTSPQRRCSNPPLVQFPEGPCRLWGYRQMERKKRKVAEEISKKRALSWCGKSREEVDRQDSDMSPDS